MHKSAPSPDLPLMSKRYALGFIFVVSTVFMLIILLFVYFIGSN